MLDRLDYVNRIAHYVRAATRTNGARLDHEVAHSLQSYANLQMHHGWTTEKCLADAKRRAERTEKAHENNA